MLGSTEGWSCDKAIQSMNRKHSFQPARRRHRFYESCIKQVFAIAFSHLASDSPLHGKTERSFKSFCKNLKTFFHAAVKHLPVVCQKCLCESYQRKALCNLRLQTNLDEQHCYLQKVGFCLMFNLSPTPPYDPVSFRFY